MEKGKSISIKRIIITPHPTPLHILRGDGILAELKIKTENKPKIIEFYQLEINFLKFLEDFCKKGRWEITYEE